MSKPTGRVPIKTNAIITNWTSDNPVPLIQFLRDHDMTWTSFRQTWYRLRRDGFLPANLPLPRPGDVAPERLADPNLPLFTDAKTTEGRFARLEQLANHGKDTAAIAAIKTLEQLKRIQGDDRWLPEPTTTEELHERLAEPLRLAGRGHAVAAFRLAFPSLTITIEEAPLETASEAPALPS